MSIPTLYIPLRTGDILWPNATAEEATTDETITAGTPADHANYVYPKVEVENQYGYRNARGTRTEWKRIDLSSLMQGASRPRTFKIIMLERNILADSNLEGDLDDNPQIPGLLFDTYLAVDSAGGSSDKRLETHYAPVTNVATLIGTSVNSGFHTGRVRYNETPGVMEWVEEFSSNALSASELRGGTFTVDPNFPFINIRMYIETIFPLDSVWTGTVGPINAIVKIIPSEGW